MTRLLPLSLLFLSACGGPREPGFQPQEVLLWELTSGAVEFGQCSDATAWRDYWSSLLTDLSTVRAYVAVQVDQAGTRAQQLDCTGIDPATCAVTAQGIVFEVAGTELFTGKNFKSPAAVDPTTGEPSRCNQAVAQSQLIEDQGERAVYTDTLSFSLVDDEEECALIDDYWKATAPGASNGLGVQGCVIRYRYEGALRH